MSFRPAVDTFLDTNGRSGPPRGGGGGGGTSLLPRFVVELLPKCISELREKAAGTLAQRRCITDEPHPGDEDADASDAP